jgi:hypothetical protein
MPHSMAGLGVCGRPLECHAIVQGCCLHNGVQSGEAHGLLMDALSDAAARWDN